MKINYKLILFFSLGLVFLLLGINYNLNIYDEAIPLVGADRLLNGEMPYRDFWTLYAPGQYFFWSGFFNLFGSSIILVRIVSAIIYIGIAYTIYKISQLLYSGKLTYIPAAIVILLGAMVNYSGRGILFGLFFFFIFLYYIIRFTTHLDRRFLMNAGISGALTVFFRHDFALYISVISIIYFIVNYQLFKSKIVNYLFVFYSALVLLSTIIYLYIMSLSGLNNIWNQLIVVPATVFRDYRATGLPIAFANINSIKDIFSFSYLFSQWKDVLFYYIPYLFIISSIYYIYKRKEVKLADSIAINSKIITILCAAFMLLNQSAVRTDFEHILPALMCGTILIPFIISSLSKRKRNIALFLICFILTVPPIIIKISNITKSFNIGGLEYLNIDKASNISVKADWQKAYSKTVEYIKSHTKKGDRIFVCNEFHDRILLNDIMLYHLSDRMPAVKYHELHPGVATELPVQTEIINTLVRNNTEYIIIVLNNFSLEPNKSAVSSNVMLLDKFIRDKYELIEQYGNYQIMCRKQF